MRKVSRDHTLNNVIGCNVALLACIASIANAQPTQGILVSDKVIRATDHDLSEVAYSWLLASNVLAVMLRQDSRIVVFDSTGRQHYTVGRAGGGPGEFATSRGQSLIRGGAFGDTLGTYDSLLRRFTLFVGNRTIKTIPLHAGYSGSDASLDKHVQSRSDVLLNVSPYALGAGGQFLGIADFGAVRKIKDEILPRPVRRAVVRAHVRSEDVVVLHELPADRSSVTAVLNADSSATRHMRVPFRIGDQTEFSPDGTRFALVSTQVDADKPSVTLTVYGADGRRHFARTLPLPEVQVTRRMIDSAFDARRREDAANPVMRRINAQIPPSTMASLEAAARKQIPRFVSSTLRIVLTSDGYVWVTIPVTSSAKEVVLLDPTGQTVLNSTLPRFHTPVAGDKASLWTLSRDADDLHVLTRYRARQTNAPTPPLTPQNKPEILRSQPKPW